jgi:lysophospholipase L1-like esterase
VRLLLAGAVLWCGASWSPVAPPAAPPAASMSGARPVSGPAQIQRQLAGAAAGAEGGAAAAQTMGQTTGQTADPADPSAYSTARWVAGGPAVLPAVTAVPAPRRFVVLGDALSAWAFAPGATQPSTAGSWPSLLESRDPDLVLVKNAGVPSNTTAQMLARLGRDVLDYNPDVLFVFGGTNDVGTDQPVDRAVINIRRIVEAAKAAGITVVLMTVPPSNRDFERHQVAKSEYNSQLAALAQSEGVMLVDVFAALAAPDGSLVADYAAYDGLHLSTLGEQALADAVYRTLHPPLPPDHD